MLLFLLHLWPNSLSLGQGHRDFIRSPVVIEFDDRVAPLKEKLRKWIEGGVRGLGIVRFARTSMLKSTLII